MTPGQRPADMYDLIVAPADSMLDVMRVIDRSGLEVALVCERDRTLVGTVTDGDLRRALIQGSDLKRPISEICNRKFTAIGNEVARAQALRMMVDRHFKCLPVVDATGKLVDLHTLYTALRGQDTGSCAVVMAGGKGERLGELTSGMPKPMIPVGDKPILEHIVLHLVNHGISTIYISVSYLGKMIEDYFEDGSRFFCKIKYLHEDIPLGTGGPLALLPEKPTKPLVVMNGDLLTRINLGMMLKFHRAGGFAATVALREHVVKVPFGVAELEGSRVRKLVEKPTLNYRINAGIYVLEPATVAKVPTGRMYPITELLDQCIKEGQGVGAYHMQEAWTDIGLPEELERVQQQLRESGKG